jgi:hypothetical protein
MTKVGILYRDNVVCQYRGQRNLGFVGCGRSLYLAPGDRSEFASDAEM